MVQLSKATEDQKALLGHLVWVAQHVAKQEGLGEGFRVVINDGPNGCESMNWLCRLCKLHGLQERYAGGYRNGRQAQ